jgi:hypothetical protein
MPHRRRRLDAIRLTKSSSLRSNPALPTRVLERAANITPAVLATGTLERSEGARTTIGYGITSPAEKGVPVEAWPWDGKRRIRPRPWKIVDDVGTLVDTELRLLGFRRRRFTRGSSNRAADHSLQT